MPSQVNWNSTFEIKSPLQDYKFNCFRCNTKNTHAFIHTIIIGNEIKSPDEVFNKENFIIVRCSTCGAFTIVHNHYKGKEWVKVGLPNSTGRKMEFDEPQVSYFPISISTDDVPEIVQEDYKLMYGCKLIGSNQGIALHYRRILDKIFSEFEKKHLTKDEISTLKKDIKERAKLISERNMIFKSFNEIIIDLKGIVSSIVHDNFENLELSDELKISSGDFEKLNSIILALLSIYKLEFIDLPSIKDKSQKIKKISKLELDNIDVNNSD